MADVARRRWRVGGQVQGVGFRPFVYRLAIECGLSGFVFNDSSGVIIEAQGLAGALGRFEQGLKGQAPPLAVIEAISSETVEIRAGEAGFRIVPSYEDAETRAGVTVDTAVCPDCVAEMFNPADRRFGYGLINCTNCGPRFSIIRRIPYDRPNTTMAGYSLCAGCAAEYRDPGNRRFHAQPVACHVCGPKVRLVNPTGKEMPGDAISTAARMLVEGKILAIKGLGGFHLAVRADDAKALGRLRKLKDRDHKPFAVMCGSIERARELVELSEAAEAAMRSPACPIVLTPRKPGANVAPGVAPGNHRLGVMLAYTPIQHLLFAALEKSDEATKRRSDEGEESGIGYRVSGIGERADSKPETRSPKPDAIVMTSGNMSDDPLVIDNAEAVERLGGMCDAILIHDRPIERCVDDSVVIDMGGSDPLPIRRARGYVPGAIGIPVASAEHGLCVGGELKNVVAVVREGRAILSQHLGDLTHALAFTYFKRAIADMCQLFDIKPRWIAHDLHPLYLSTSYAQQLAKEWNVPLLGIQHHHAHAAAVMAEHGEKGPMLAVVCDGTGFGTDRTIWGGELLVASLTGFERIGRLRPMMLPGGDAAARDTRRCGLGLLHMAFGEGFAEHPAARRLVPDDADRAMLCEMMRRGINCAETSSTGRVFDGAAALLGLCACNEYQAQAGMAMEAAGEGVDAGDMEELFELRDKETRGQGDKGKEATERRSDEATKGAVEIDLSPLVRWIIQEADVRRAASVFHEQLARAWEAAVMAGVERTGIRTVGLSGGVFCNQRLTELLEAKLANRGLRVLRHRVVPANDGGLALGQAAIAAAMMKETAGVGRVSTPATPPAVADKNVCPTVLSTAAPTAVADKNVCPTGMPATTGNGPLTTDQMR